MANMISEYLSRFIEAYRGISVADMVREAYASKALFVEKDGVLGCKPRGEGIWEVLFFVAESKETRKKLVAKAGEKLGKIKILFNRPKHGDRERTYGPDYWMRLA